jgi:hypothetical protein
MRIKAIGLSEHGLQIERSSSYLLVNHRTWMLAYDVQRSI